MYISVNQSFVKEEDARFGILPWSWQTLGCSITEDIRANAAQPLLIDKHLSSILKKSELLKFKLPYFFDQKFVIQQISGLLKRNKLFQAATVRITLARNIESAQTELIISCKPAGAGPYELNKKGLAVDVFSDIDVVAHHPSLLNQYCQAVNSIAKAAAKEMSLDDMLLTVCQGFIVSATESSFFAVSGKKIMTPPVEIGAREDVLSDFVKNIIRNIGYELDDEALVMREDLPALDEVFLCDTANGLRWVGGYKNRRYIHKESSKINAELNRILFE